MKKLLPLLALLISSYAEASCRISNETSKSFTVSSGDETGRGLGPYTSDSFRSGDLVIEGDSDTVLTGYCEDGKRFTLVEIRGPRGNVIVVLRQR